MIDYLVEGGNITHWVSTIGYLGVFLVIFLETGVFMFFFLPGDSLVFAAGLLAAKGFFHLEYLIPGLITTATLGYMFGYWFGHKLGHWLLRRPESFFFKRRYLSDARRFCDRHGGKALLFARLVPIVRTFMPIVAGMAMMSYRTYFMFNVLGAIIWGGGVTLAGYFLGALIPDAANYIVYVIVAVIALSLLPGVWHYCRQQRRY